MKIIGLTGKAGAGKDTVADYLATHFHFVKYPLAKPIKDMLAVIGVDANDRATKEKPHPVFGVSPRRMAQTLGTEWGRMCIRNDFWLKVAELHIEAVRIENGAAQFAPVAGIVIPDIRFENEAEWLRSQGGTLWHIMRKVPAVEAHASEAGVAHKPGDAVIDNDHSIDFAYRQANWLMGRS